MLKYALQSFHLITHTLLVLADTRSILKDEWIDSAPMHPTLTRHSSNYGITWSSSMCCLGRTHTVAPEMYPMLYYNTAIFPPFLEQVLYKMLVLWGCQDIRE